MKFLSPEWVAQLDQQLKASGLRLPASADRYEMANLDADAGNPSFDLPSVICIQNIVRLPGSEPDLCYFITVDTRCAMAASGLAKSPNLTFAQTWEVAAAIAQGRRDSHEAFLMGEIKVTGDVSELLPLEDIALQVQQVSAALNQQAVF